jgi:truncated hemoglobin YjbI
MIMGGKNDYKGLTMRTAHSELDIHDTHFKAMIECYRQAMLENEIDELDVEVLIAKLAYMKHEVLNN